MTHDPIQAFIDRWSKSGGAERANYQLFLGELCELLDVPSPGPTVPEDDDNAYVFERRVVFINPDGTQSYGWIDLYKRGCFVLALAFLGALDPDEAPTRRTTREIHSLRSLDNWCSQILRTR